MPFLQNRGFPLLTGICISCFCAALPCAGQNTEVQQQIQLGAAAMRNGQPQVAEQAFREAVRLAPGMAEAHTDLALVLGRESKEDEAIAELRQAILLDPTQSAPDLYLGIFLFHANHPEEARAALKQAITLAPGSIEALTWLGNVDLATGHPERAVLSFDKAAELTPDDLTLLELRGRAHNQVAHDSYARMARLDPGSWHVHRVQAQLYADEERHPEAIAEYQLALKQQPANPDLYEALGDQYRADNQLEQAQTAYATEVKLAPGNPVALYNLGSVDVERGESAAGVPLLQMMVMLYPGSAVADYYLARGLASLNKEEEAVPWFTKSSSEDPNGEIGKRSFYELARLQHRLHHPAQAQVALAGYNRIRNAQDKASSQQVQDWKKLSQPVVAESSTSAEPAKP